MFEACDQTTQIKSFNIFSAIIFHLAHVEITLKYNIGTGATKQLVNFVCEEGRNFIEDYVRIKIRNNFENLAKVTIILELLR